MSLFAEVVGALVDLFALSMALGLIFALLAYPQRQLLNYLLAIFCGALAAWSVASLLRAHPDFGSEIGYAILFKFQMTATALTTGASYLLVIGALRPKGRTVRIFTVILPVIFLLGLVFIWSGKAFEISSTGQITVLDGTQIFYGVLCAVAILTFWIVISSQHKNAPMLRLPSGFIILGFASSFINPVMDFPLDVFLITLAALLVGWVVLQRQVFRPLNALKDELRVSNRDLQQVVSKLTDEKSNSEALNRRLIAANQYKNEFVSNMSHELRTPLNSILGYSELLRNGIYGQLNEKQSDRLEKIYRNGVHLLDLISNILDLNTIDAGELQLSDEQFELSEIVKQTVLQLKEKSEEKKLPIIVSIEPNLPPLKGDYKRIQQIMVNLLDNAIKFTFEGQIFVNALKVKVYKGKSDEFILPVLGWLRDGNWVIISIVDTGIGIAPEDQARIFEEFSQVDGSHTREFGGTGLGLAISKRLVEMHKGVIWLKSTPDQGSTFFVAMPIDETVAANSSPVVESGINNPD